MKEILIIIILISPLITLAQRCDCKDNFEWVKQTFEKNDAGFDYAIAQKGEEAYKQHNQIFNKAVKRISTPDQCYQTIYEWLTFFRTGHIGIQAITEEQEQQGNRVDTNKIINRYTNWEKLDMKVTEFKQYLSSNKVQGYEGIWRHGVYEIGIKKIGDEYIGFIIEADGIYWTEGQIKLKIYNDNSSVYYMRDHSPKDFDSIAFLGNNFLEMGFISLKREFPISDKDESIERYFKAIDAKDPYLDKIEENTLLLRIPRFWHSEKAKIDSIIDKNRKLILQTPNLIIDLRDNGGGSDESFEELIPIIYTNPIRQIGVKMLSTQLNNQRMLDIIEDETYALTEEDKASVIELYDKLSSQIGEFVMLGDNSVEVITLDTVYEYPKNIAILINENNASTTEQFLLAAKQSKKVKLFGRTTAGILDISNMYFVQSPCQEFELGYSLSKSMRIPEMTIDGRGIQPDYYIDEGISKYGWIDHIMKILEE